MATRDEYDLAVLRCYAKEPTPHDDWGWIPEAAGPLYRFDRRARGLHEVVDGRYRLTDKGRLRLAELEELLRDVDVKDLMAEEAVLEERLQAAPHMRFTFEQRPGADFTADEHRIDGSAVPVLVDIVYDRTRLRDAYRDIGAYHSEMDYDFVPFVVVPFMHEGHVVWRIEGVLAVRKMDDGFRNAHRSRFTVQRYHVMKHPKYGDWIRSTTERGLYKKVRNFRPVAAEPEQIEEPKTPTEAEIAMERADAAAYAAGID